MLGRAEVEDNLGVLSVDVRDREITVVVRDRIAGAVWCESFQIVTVRHPKVLAQALWRVLRGGSVESVVTGLCIKAPLNEAGDRREIVIEAAFRAVIDEIRRNQPSQPTLPFGVAARPSGERDGRRRL